MAVQEEDGAQCLVLSGSCHIPVGGKMDDECLNFGKPHLSGMALVVIDNVAFAPVHIGLLGAVRVMFGPQRIAELVEEFFPFLGGVRVVLRRGKAGHVYFSCAEKLKVDIL
jgi:hypothetical protein